MWQRYKEAAGGELGADNNNIYGICEVLKYLARLVTFMFA
jgi:hypothetical protein